MNFIRLDSVDSTNNEARRLLDNGIELSDFTVIAAEAQTSGRGQRGNSWECEEGKNLSFSIICHPEFLRPADQYVLSECIALAVQRAMQSAIRSTSSPEKADAITVKWPNDIYYADHKISGTLIECDLMGMSVRNCIIGTGVNINQTRFLSDAPNPISLINIIGDTTDRETILQSILHEFIALYDLIQQGRASTIHSLYLDNLYRKDGLCYEFIDQNGPFTALIHDVEPSGRMILQTADGILHRYEFKEVKFVI